MTLNLVANNINNRILLALPRASLGRIEGVLDPVSLTRGQVIARIDRPLTHVYFINRGIVSVVKTMSDGRMVEIGAVGIEGMTSAHTYWLRQDSSRFHSPSSWLSPADEAC